MGACPRLGKLFGGCTFSPRYDDLAPSSEAVKIVADAQGYVLPDDVAGLRSRTYFGEACERCGKIVKRSA